MARAIVAVGCLFVLLPSFGSASLLADGLLSSARSEVWDSSSSSSKSSSSSHSDEDEDSGDSFLGSLLTSLFSSSNGCDQHNGGSSFDGGAIFTVVASPWLIPRSILEGKDEVLSIAAFPYTENWDGYYVNQDPQPEWAKPWVVSGSIDWGTLGHAAMFHGRATVGVMLNRLEVFTGYDYLKLGGTSLPSFVA